MKTHRTRHLGASHRLPAQATRRSGGYALLLTLVMLALTAVTIGTLAHSSGAEALRAREAERGLQTRWAEASGRRVLLPLLQARLTDALDQWRSDEQGGHISPPTSVRVSIDLQDVRIVARLDDQQAMPSVNRLLATKKNGQPQNVRRVLAETTFRERLVPMPMDEAVARRIGASPYGAWGQLYPAATPGELSGLSPTAMPHAGLAYEDAGSSVTLLRGVGVTLWGDGRLNLWTASPEALHRVLDESIGVDQVAKLLGMRDDHRGLSARQLVGMMNLGPSERAAARLALTDQTQAFAMWMVVVPTEGGRPRPGQRARWTLIVDEGDDGFSGDRARAFRW